MIDIRLATCDRGTRVARDSLSSPSTIGLSGTRSSMRCAKERVALVACHGSTAVRVGQGGQATTKGRSFAVPNNKRAPKPAFAHKRLPLMSQTSLELIAARAASGHAQHWQCWAGLCQRQHASLRALEACEGVLWGGVPDCGGSRACKPYSTAMA